MNYFQNHRLDLLNILFLAKTFECWTSVAFIIYIMLINSELYFFVREIEREM
jgi:hypothetical protein